MAGRVSGRGTRSSRAEGMTQEPNRRKTTQTGSWACIPPDRRADRGGPPGRSTRGAECAPQPTVLSVARFAGVSAVLDIPCETLISTGRENYPRTGQRSLEAVEQGCSYCEERLRRNSRDPALHEVRKSAKRLRCDAEATVVSCRSIKNFHQENAVFVTIRTNPHNFYSEAS